MSNSANYPANAEVVNPPVRFRPATITAVKRFASSKPYRGSVSERRQKFTTLHHNLCRIYGTHTRLSFGVVDGDDSWSSSYSPITDEITLCGRLSVVTMLHEFAHVLGRDERGAVRWSVHLFRICFPRSFARCQTAGHMLRRPSTCATSSPPPACDSPRI